MEQIYQEIKLKDICCSPFNPRNRFEGRKFDELVKSVASVGVIEPVLVRPVTGKETPFELVAGERRWRASGKVARNNGGVETATIPAMIKQLSDDEAFELLTIENLQREDLTELEEAAGFKSYLERKGPDSLDGLAQRTGINPGYIRRRVAVLELPARVLKAWEAGKLKYGHLEQFIRVADKKMRQALVTETLQQAEWMTVRRLRDNIASSSPHLKTARFDIKNDCVGCAYNSEIQRQIFDIEDGDKARCLNPKCFKQKQNNYFMKNWKKRKTGTAGFRFYSDLDYNEWHSFLGGGPYKKCKTCEKYISIIRVDGDMVEKQACLDKSCLENLQRQKSQKIGSKRAAGSDDGSPRVSWHGDYFREKFYQASIPERFGRIKTSLDMPDAVDIKARLILFALLKSNTALHRWFAGRIGIEAHAGWYQMDSAELFSALEKMDYKELLEIEAGATLEAIMQDVFGSTGRRLVADHIGVDLQAEFRMDEEYLQKKTKAELIAIGENFTVFEQKCVQDFLFETLLKKRRKYTSCKKGELIRLFLESGADLAGVVPPEILEK